MPLPRLQAMLLMLSMLTLMVLLCYLSFNTFTPASSHRQATSSFLFPASAVISLTDDNSTFFISRPAAFGPALLKDGMDGELFVLEEGQLACDDTPGWDPSAVPNIGVPVLPEGAKDDGTDNILNPSLPSTMAKTNWHADIETLQQSAELEGKIILVSRGGCGFLEKVLWAQRRGGIALIVGDYKRPGIGGSSGLVTMYAQGDTSNVSIPSVFTSHTTAALLTTLLPKVSHPVSLVSSLPAPLPQLPTPEPVPSLGPPDHNQPLSDELIDQLQSSGVVVKDSVKSLPVHQRTGLWITLTPTTMTSSPFFDTLLVLVVSPLVTLTVVYALLLIRSRIRRRRWRAPKSLVERLPVRTYQSTASTPQSATFPLHSPSLPSGYSDSRDGNAEATSTASPRNTCPSPPQQLNATSPPHAVVGNGFHRRWSGCNECVVCLEEYVDGVSRVMKLPCGHEFHAGCITPWLTTRRRTCPICKGDVVRGVRATTSEGFDGASADETTPLVLAADEDDDWEERDLEIGTLRRG